MTIHQLSVFVENKSGTLLQVLELFKEAGIQLIASTISDTVEYGIYRIICSVKLSDIHHAIHSDDLDALFGMQGCSLEPHYPFGLPLEKWAPDWFLPTGDCGYDNSDVPMGTVLSPLQESIIQMYSDAGGWYLIPSMKFMSMAQCCLLGFIVALAIYAILFIGDMKHVAGVRKAA